MICPICGSNSAEIEYRNGKFNKKAALVGGLLTGGIGLIAGFKDTLVSRGFITCKSCRYSQLGHNPDYTLKVKDMEPFNSGTLFNHDLSLIGIVDDLRKMAKYRNIPCNVRYDEVDSVPAGTSLASYPCVVIEHPEHPNDYLKICIQKNSSGSQCILTAYVFGRSPQLEMEDFNNNQSPHSALGIAAAITGAVSGDKPFLTGAGIGHEIGSVIGTSIKKSINSSKMNSSALQWEKLWYADVLEMIGDLS